MESSTMLRGCVVFSMFVSMVTVANGVAYFKSLPHGSHVRTRCGQIGKGLFYKNRKELACASLDSFMKGNYDALDLRFVAVIQSTDSQQVKLRLVHQEIEKNVKTILVHESAQVKRQEIDILYTQFYENYMTSNNEHEG